MRKIKFDKKRGLYVPDSIHMQNKGYGEAGASWRKRAVKGFNAPSGSAHEDIDFNNFTLRQRSRMLYMAAPVATSAVKTNRTNVVGVGLQLKSRIDREVLGLSPEQAESWQKNTEREFGLWAKNKQACDATGMNNFYGLQQLALVSWLLSGDCIGLIKQYPVTRLLPYSMRVHLIESDRIATPGGYGSGGSVTYTTGRNPENGNTIYDGVEVDSNGMVVAYHIRSNYPFELGAPETTWARVLAYQEHTGLPNVLHIIDTERPDQYRGVSYLAQVIEPLLQIRRYTESELMAAVVESFYTAFIKTEAPTDENPFNQTDPDMPGEMRGPNDYSMGPGQINIMAPGEDVEFANPTHPNGSFDKFVAAISTQIGAALEIPADLLLKQFNSSYSASRAALLEAWKAFKMRREWLADDFCRPCYEVWMSEAVARGRIYAPGFFDNPMIRSAYLGSEWLGPSQGQLDPVKEITAEILACSEGFSTHEQSTIRLNGGQWDSNIEQLQRENEKLGGNAPDPHQNGSGSGTQDPQEGELAEEDNNPHSPENTRRRSAEALRGLIISEQIRQSIQGGTANESTE
ncbi:MAG TPA: phage portal protein [Candidatus Limivivens intestinipullorum]|uniref:Phage portal protein n=1 Tax=Candidatus Limivivens intestinipullorum TaxID=2840858 RepID=A0A9D1JL01_9FIRM|nr:phage portal protein [Candidatus Limivivens intestinipullorum]